MPETYSSGLHRAPLPGACARVFRDRDHLDQLCFSPQQAFPFLQAAGKWWSPTKPLAYSCWILIFLAADEGHTTFPGRHTYFHDSDGNCIEIIGLYKGQPNTTET
jgi:hypothetical protein